MLTSPFAFLDFESCLPSPFEVTYICPTSHGTARRHAGDWRRDGVDSGGARILAGAGKRRIRGGIRRRCYRHGARRREQRRKCWCYVTGFAVVPCVLVSPENTAEVVLALVYWGCIKYTNTIVYSVRWKEHYLAVGLLIVGIRRLAE